MEKLSMRKASAFSVLLVLVMLVTLVFAPMAEAASSSDLSAAKKLVTEYSLYEPSAALLNAKDMDTFIAELSKVDHYCFYLTKAEVKEFINYYDAYIISSGVAFEANEAGQIVVMAVVAETPAAEAGILRGDIVKAVNGASIEGKTLDEALEIMSNTASLSLELERNGAIKTYQLKRIEMPLPSIMYWMLDSETAYMQIYGFETMTAEQVEAGLKYLKKLGMKSLVLDLRDCPGGYMETAGLATDLFIGDGPMYFYVSRFGYEAFMAVYHEENFTVWDMPLAVLVNQDTASAAEMMAAVLQDSKRATVIGSATFGKGIYQNILDLPSGGALYFTTGKYITRGYQDISQAGGVTPDILVSDDADAQQNAAIAWLKKQQAVPKTYTFTIGSTSAKADSIAFSLNYAPFLNNGTSYLPMADTLKKLGWDLYYQDGNWYGFNGIYRCIIDTKNQKIISGNRNGNIIVRNNSVFLPAGFFRNLGYEVIWDSANNTITLNK